MSLKSALVIATLVLATGNVNANMLNSSTPANKCEAVFHAKTHDNGSDAFMCVTQSNILFAFGTASSKYPEILLSVPKAEVQVRSYSHGLTRVGYDILIPNGDKWQVISSRPEGAYIKEFTGTLTLASVRKELDDVAGIAINNHSLTNSIWTVKGLLEIQEDF